VKSIYCGGGFYDNQLLWIIPLLDGYCKENSVDTIIFERKLSSRIINNISIAKIVKNYNILSLKNNSSFFKSISIFFFLIKNFINIFYYSLVINRNILLKKKISWKKTQIFHSIWDTSFFYLKDGDLNPSFFHKLKAALRVFLNIYFAYSLKNKNTRAAFMGHSVYTARAMISIFRELKLKIIVHANSSLYSLPLSFDNSWSIFNKNVLKKITTRKLLKKSILYWNGRLRGYSNYEDAKIAYKKKTYLKNYDNFNFDNVIFLHIFRDSPFNVIDRNRIFSDYIDWIDKTLRIIKNSKENWIIKPHPNFERWGEDSFKTYKNILDNVFNNHQSKNIKYIFQNISNIELLKRAKRIVTFSGTVHVEAACLGLKPIVISKCTLSNFGNNSVLKPKSLNQYSKLLLMDSKSPIFRLSEKKKKYAIYMLFIRENVINLRKDLNSSSIYRADKKKIRDAEFYNICSNLDKNIDFLRRTGKFIEKNNNTIAKKYFNI